MKPSLFHNMLIGVAGGSVKALARCISLVENQVDGYDTFLQSLPVSYVPVIGVTGPPGAGKSTLVDGLVACLVAQQKRVGIICVDPSSPFNLGALLGDRIRMSSWYNQPAVFIRSLASRGSVGGLHPSIIEITDVMKAAPFDYIIIETVGVGQSEIEIAGLADITIVTLVPEAGDEIQTMKAGLMEIADIFVLNKADRPNADDFERSLKLMLSGADSTRRLIPVLRTVALKQQGLQALAESIEQQLKIHSVNDKRYWLLAERCYYLVQKKRMANVSRSYLRKQLQLEASHSSFNLYQFISRL